MTSALPLIDRRHPNSAAQLEVWDAPNPKPPPQLVLTILLKNYCLATLRLVGRISRDDGQRIAHALPFSVRPEHPGAS